MTAQTAFPCDVVQGRMQRGAAAAADGGVKLLAQITSLKMQISEVEDALEQFLAENDLPKNSDHSACFLTRNFICKASN